jgi:hypothetical protein
MLETDAGLKYGIKYKNFYEKNDEGYFYPFGDGLFSEKNTAEMWQFKKLLYPSIGVSDYCKTFYSRETTRMLWWYCDERFIAKER